MLKPELNRACPNCGGKGYETEGGLLGGSYDCSTCNGTGEV